MTDFMIYDVSEAMDCLGFASTLNAAVWVHNFELAAANLDKGVEACLDWENE